MGTVLPENLCAHRKGAIEELIKGRARDTAAQLQTLFGKPTGGDHDGLEELLVKHLISFTESLSHVSPSSCEDCECEVTQIPNRVGSPIDDQRSVNSGESCKSPAAEDWRGCYKRRKTSEMRMEVSTTNEDGHAWRKYGQTKILEAQFPMCYFRCIHEFDQGCQATKRVQRIQEAPHMYRTTYFGHHTCRSYSLNNPLLEAHLRSFSSKTFSSDSESHPRSFSSIAISTQYTRSRPSSASSVRSFSSETISTQDSESYALSFSAKTISTQYTSSCASSAASVRKKCGEESREIVQSNSLVGYFRDTPVFWSLLKKGVNILDSDERLLALLVPGGRDKLLPVILEQAAEYNATLERQVTAMSALTELLSISGPNSGSRSLS